MAEENETAPPADRDDATRLSRRSDRRPVARKPRLAVRIARPARTRPRGTAKPLRSLVILTMVGGLVATVALPAYGAWRTTEVEAVTLQQVAADNAQSLVVASDATSTDLDRDSYSATTSAEIAKKKAEEAAAARAKALAASTASASSMLASVDLSMVAPGSGEVRWPISGYTLGDGFRSRGGAHMGIDMLAPAGTPIYAAAAGVVRVSQESFGGYGVAVTIDHVINGVKVSTLYGHMTYGSRQVSSGQTVKVGQLIGLVGSTGRSTANHLHFEVFINGSNVDPLSWLKSNAG
ncbi:M23 family metallopeptidase [Microbacterium fluvii]|uniref:M23 family metallopeptidase n=1 Tax=Microbacterium fluvii TaxID=415215 RepID=A0ABW2HCI5_9MICO|nr:M23 family metallopeptidase [Microbacterium fluvii]MCU4671795.1 M23 family metallopeptidase [Microbacterium fluvii]